MVSLFSLFLTPNSRFVFHAGVSLNIHSFIHVMVSVIYPVLDHFQQNKRGNDIVSSNGSVVYPV